MYAVGMACALCKPTLSGRKYRMTYKGLMPNVCYRSKQSKMLASRLTQHS
jgi:hypothetical protein